jgi:4-hydroxybenzoate polyprenyltransferase
VLALAAFALVLTTNRLTVLWSFAALAITLAYPFAKRFVSIPQAVLGIAFSFGIPMAFARPCSRRCRAGGHGCWWATCSGCWPTTPSTRWSTATTT